ncbi:MAG: TlpA family protein disulfide reductase [Candidatus Acidiferrales bacterium]
MRMVLVVVTSMLVATVAVAQQQGAVQNKKQTPQAAPFHLVVNTPKNAPDFALRDSQGKLIRLSDYKGKVVLVDFWATWCGGCKEEIPWYIDFEKKYGKKGFLAIGIAEDRGFDVVRPFMAEHKMNYPVAIDNMSLLAKYGDNGAMPATYLVAPDGRIVDYTVGIVNRAEFERKIQAMLGRQDGEKAD